MQVHKETELDAESIIHQLSSKKLQKYFVSNEGRDSNWNDVEYTLLNTIYNITLSLFIML